MAGRACFAISKQSDRGVQIFRFMVALLVFILLSVPLSAQQAAKKPNVLVYSQGIAGDGLEEVLTGFNRSVSDALGQSDLNAVIIEEDTERQELLDTADWLDAYFLVESLYLADQYSFQLEINAYSTWDGKMIAMSAIAGSIESLDSVSWDTAMDEIVRTIRTYLQIIEEEDITTNEELAALSEREIEIIATVPAVAVATFETTVTQENTDTRETVNDIDSEIQSGTSEPMLIPDVRPIYLELAVAPLVAVGSASDLFKVGITSVLSGGYTLKPGFGELDLGLMMELSYFHADGVLVSSENWLLSLGPDAGFGLGLGTRFRLYGGLSTGIVLSFVEVSNGDQQTLVGVFLSGRLGGRFHFDDRFSLAVTNRFTTYFLPSAPISGFQPSLSFGFRF